MKAAALAHNAVSAAVAQGILPRVNTQACVDCGKPAQQYEHRDYGRPLEVQPTCRRCNIARGPAKGAQPGEFNTVFGRWLKDQPPGTAAALARHVGCAAALLSQWAHGVRPMPVERMASIEAATGRVVMRWDLRPEDWHAIWPELVGLPGSPRTPKPAAEAQA